LEDSLLEDRERDGFIIILSGVNGLCGWNVDGTASVLCSVADFGISGFEISISSIRDLCMLLEVPGKLRTIHRNTNPSFPSNTFPSSHGTFKAQFSSACGGSYEVLHRLRAGRPGFNSRQGLGYFSSPPRPYRL